MWIYSVLPFCLLVSAAIARPQREPHLLKVQLTSQNPLCQLTGSELIDADSYKITASGTDNIFCSFRIREVEPFLIRLGYGLNPGESIWFTAEDYSVQLVIDHTNRPFDCFYFNANKEQDIIVSYFKSDGVFPGLEVTLTEAECADDSDDSSEDDVTCAINECSFLGNGPYCSAVAIDSRFRCDMEQNCPFGEDETCGTMTTVTPGQITQPPNTEETGHSTYYPTSNWPWSTWFPFFSSSTYPPYFSWPFNMRRHQAANNAKLMPARQSPKWSSSKDLSSESDSHGPTTDSDESSSSEQFTHGPTTDSIESSSSEQFTNSSGVPWRAMKPSKSNQKA